MERGHAYLCFCTPDELAAKREAAQREGRPPGYDHLSPPSTRQRRRRRRDQGEPASIRYAVPRPGATSFDDQIRGEVRFDRETIDDFVLLRSDGTPTYHLASTVDDVDYEISHVARGEDLLPSTPTS